MTNAVDIELSPAASELVGRQYGYVAYIDCTFTLVFTCSSDLVMVRFSFAILSQLLIQYTYSCRCMQHSEIHTGPKLVTREIWPIVDILVEGPVFLSFAKTSYYIFCHVAKEISVKTDIYRNE